MSSQVKYASVTNLWCGISYYCSTPSRIVYETCIWILIKEIDVNSERARIVITSRYIGEILAYESFFLSLFQIITVLIFISTFEYFPFLLSSNRVLTKSRIQCVTVRLSCVCVFVCVLIRFACLSLQVRMKIVYNISNKPKNT